MSYPYQSSQDRGHMCVSCHRPRMGGGAYISTCGCGCENGISEEPYWSKKDENAR